MLREVLLSIENLAHRCKTDWRGRPVLIDLRRVRPVPDVTVRALVGEHIATTLGFAGRIASVVMPDAYTAQSERVAQRFGAEFIVFTSVDEAVDWLASD